MNKPDEQASGKEAQEPKPSRLEEVRQIIEQYAGDLRGDHQETPPTLELKAPQLAALSYQVQARADVACWHRTYMPTTLRDVRSQGAKRKTYARIELFRF